MHHNKPFNLVTFELLNSAETPTPLTMDSDTDDDSVTSTKEARSVSGLERMPIEILNQIIEDLSFDDFCKLRIVSRKLDWLTFETFVRHTKTQASQQGGKLRNKGRSLRLVASSRQLKSLHAITRIDEISRPITHLHICYSLLHEEALRDYTLPEFPDNLRIGLSPCAEKQLELFEQLCYKYAQNPRLLTEMRASDKDILYMKEVLKSMEDPQEIDLEGLELPECWWRHPFNEVSVSDAITRASTVLLSSVFQSRIQIRRLKISRISPSRFRIDPAVFLGACRPSAFEIPETLHHSPSQQLEKLASLRVTLWDGATDDGKAFGRFLAACPNLQGLTVSGLAHEGRRVCLGPTLLQQIAASIPQNRLEILGLNSFLVHPKDLWLLLDRQQNTLDSITLRDGYLIDGHWDTIFRRVLWNLASCRVDLELFFELRVDGYVRWKPNDLWDCFQPELARTPTGKPEGDKFKSGDYSKLVDYTNFDENGNRRFRPSARETLSPDIRHWAEDFFQLDTSLDLSWLFFEED
ncbi:hypothetical protein IWZ01DRAFT_563690 [Phyllosticta capitalensis]